MGSPRFSRIGGSKGGGGGGEKGKSNFTRGWSMVLNQKGIGWTRKLKREGRSLKFLTAQLKTNKK